MSDALTLSFHILTHKLRFVRMMISRKLRICLQRLYHRNLHPHAENIHTSSSCATIESTQRVHTSTMDPACALFNSVVIMLG